MIDEILIEHGVNETRVALLSGSTLQEVLIERPERRSLVGDVYLGRVNRVVRGVNAAFVDLGLERHGFLAAGDARFGPNGRDGDDAAPPRIEERVHEGQAVLVQVSHDPIEDKGARVSTALTLPGRFMVYAPGQARVAVSRRIRDEDERARLENVVRALVDSEGGFILRTSAEGAEPTALEAEALHLKDEWQDIRALQATVEPPARVREEEPLITRLFRDHLGGGAVRVRVEGEAALADVRGTAERIVPDLVGRVEHHTGPGRLFDEHEVEAQIEAALEARVALPSGGALTIEETTALTAVDVDMGGAGEGRSKAGAALDTNLEAAAELARQLRLRAIGGLVVVDFLRMGGGRDVGKLTATLREVFAADPGQARVSGSTRTGLVEIVRRRLRPPLAEMLTEPCRVCGNGRVPALDMLARGVLRRAQAEAEARPGGSLIVTAAPEVVQALTAGAESLVDGLRARTGRSVEVRVGVSYPRTRYEVAVQ